MAYIQKRGERKYKITVCNGYKTNGQKRQQARTIDVPKEIPARKIKQYVYAEAERLEKRFKYGIEEDERTKFEDHARAWLARQKKYKASTLAGYAKMLETVYPMIGGLPLCKIRAVHLEEMCEELRRRPGKQGSTMSEATVQKYLDTVSAVLENARKNDILLYNPARRVDKLPVRKKPQRIPQSFEIERLLQCFLQEPTMYCVYYLMALSTGLRRGELCALRWSDLHGGRVLRIQRSRSTVVGQGVVESDTKNHRDRAVVLSELVYDVLGQWRYEQLTSGYTTALDSLIFATTKGPVHPDTFSRHLRRLYDRNGFPREYHLHTLRHYFASYLLENNISKQVTADMLGHADTAFLERTYCHPQYDYKAQAAHLLNDLIVPINRDLYPETDVTA